MACTAGHFAHTPHESPENQTRN